MKRDIWTLVPPEVLDAPPAHGPLIEAKVMMVDDEPLMTDLIQTYLEDAGYSHFVVTNDPLQALPLLRSERPGLLLLDLMMPKMSGFEILEAMQADRTLRYTPVIVLTASTGAEAKLRALRLGATDFLAKPVDESELGLRVRNTLAFRQYHQQLVNFDAVTGLPNPPLFDRGLASLLERRALAGGLLAMCSIHVPELRQLHESVGRAAAEELAKALAQRLLQFAGEHDPGPDTAAPIDQAPRACRISADRFGVVLEGPDDSERVESAVRRLVAALCQPLLLSGHEVVPSVWVGIAVSPGDGNSADTLRQGAELAATHAMGQGEGRYKFHSAELNARSFERLSLGSQLRGAAQRGELVLHYQPKVDLRSGRVAGVEALVRWQHPVLGLLSPLRFVPLAEELGLIRGIGDWVIDRACHDVAAWARAGHAGIKVAVNVAKPQFMAGDLAQVIGRAVLSSGLPASQMIVEVTETLLMDKVEAAMAQMHVLKALGVTLSIDDFGTGYSSLSYLKRFPLDELKIDRSFIIDLPGQQADLAIVRTVVDLGHNLGMSVTAEGVETQGQLECLRTLGCDTYQGYLFSRPVPSAQLLEQLALQAEAWGAAQR